jgi:hypothetical protein
VLVENLFKSEIMSQLNSFFKLRWVDIKNRIISTFPLAFNFLENSNDSS